MTLAELRTLSRLASEAAAALLPLAADPRGRDHHGGVIANPGAVIARALVTLERAGHLASEHRRIKADPDPGPPGGGRNLFPLWSPAGSAEETLSCVPPIFED